MSCVCGGGEPSREPRSLLVNLMCARLRNLTNACHTTIRRFKSDKYMISSCDGCALTTRSHIIYLVSNLDLCARPISALHVHTVTCALAFFLGRRAQVDNAEIRTDRKADRTRQADVCVFACERICEITCSRLCALCHRVCLQLRCWRAAECSQRFGEDGATELHIVLFAQEHTNTCQ